MKNINFCLAPEGPDLQGTRQLNSDRDICSSFCERFINLCIYLSIYSFIFNFAHNT